MLVAGGRAGFSASGGAGLGRGLLGGRGGLAACVWGGHSFFWGGFGGGVYEGGPGGGVVSEVLGGVGGREEAEGGGRRVRGKGGG